MYKKIIFLKKITNSSHANHFLLPVQKTKSDSPAHLTADGGNSPTPGKPDKPSSSGTTQLLTNSAAEIFIFEIYPDRTQKTRAFIFCSELPFYITALVIRSGML
jgi:hypothetical protein